MGNLNPGLTSFSEGFYSGNTFGRISMIVRREGSYMGELYSGELILSSDGSYLI